jgi:ribose-phosphate pyrophosphokinase
MSRLSNSQTAGPRAQPFQAPQGDLAVLAGSGNPRLAQAVARELGVALSPCRAHVFSEGNVFVQIQENVRGRDTFIIQGVHCPVNDNFVELLFWIDALKRASAQQVTAVIPFFSYAKGDKKDEPRVSIRARVCADAIEAAGADRVLTMDLHSPQIQGFFGIPVDHLYGRYVISAHVKKLEIPNLVVCSPDIGFAKDASAYAKLLGVPVVIGNKQRTDHSERAEVLEVIGEVKGKNVLMVDDFTITGNSLISMAELLKRRGAHDIYAAVTHGVLSTGAAARLAASPIKHLFITDTIETVQNALPPNVSVISVANLFAKSIRSIHDRTSVSSLFPDTKSQS